MKAKVSLVSAITAAIVAVCAPGAFADPGLQGAPQIDVAQTAPDWFERAAATAERNAVSAPYVDAFERPVAVSAPSSTEISTTSAGTAWTQIGVALGLGLVLGLGLMLALRHRPRPVAQQ